MDNFQKGKEWIPIGIFFSLVLLISGCRSVSFSEEQGHRQNRCGNAVMGNGTFLMDGEMVYYTDKEYIYRYDRVQDQITVAPAEDVYGQMNFWNGQIVYKKFSDGNLYTLNLNGEMGKRIYADQEENRIAQIYIEGNEWYYLTGYGGKLIRADQKTGTKIILSDRVRSFYITEDKIYVIRQQQETETVLTVSDKDMIRFETVPLSFSPVCIFPVRTGDTTVLYLNKADTFDLAAVSETGTILEEYPIHTLYYQVWGETIYYMDQDTFDEDYILMTYHTETKEKNILAEQVFDFCVLEERYIGICQLFKNTYWLYDTVTEEWQDMTMRVNTVF